jgi:hypothetical protein
MAIPVAPDEALDPASVVLEPWPPGRIVHRVFAVGRAPNEFNPTASPGRFRPFTDRNGDIVPTLYAASTMAGALAESVFHDVPVDDGTEWVIPASLLSVLRHAELVPRRELSLVALTGWAFKRLRLRGRALVECGPEDYPQTATWAEAFYDLPSEPDGLLWRSRQFDDAHAVMLFGDRAGPTVLDPVAGSVGELGRGVGLHEVRVVAEHAGAVITI